MLLKEMMRFNLASQRSKVQLAPPTREISTIPIQDGRANSKIRYIR